MHIKFQKNGVTREVKHGFSWTIFCFGAAALLVRRQYGLAVICLLTLGLANFYFIFSANRLLARSMAENGWKALEQPPAAWGITSTLTS
jgi:hypothetical protein